jgi:hypothetical protein
MMFGFYYRPALSASIAIGQELHDNRPIWFHIENLALHAAAVAMAIWMFRLLFKRRVTALVAGLLFAIHPIQVCFTTFIGGRTESMVAIFILMFAIGVHNAARRMSLRSRIHGPIAEAKIAAWIAVSVVGVLGAVFSKEQVAPIVLLAPLFAMPFRKRPLPVRRTRRKRVSAAYRSDQSKPPYWTAIYFLPIMLFMFAAHRALHDIDFVEAPWTPGLRIEMVGRTLWSYTKIYFFPTVRTQHVTTLGAWEPPQIAAAALGFLVAITWVTLLFREWNNRPHRILMLWVSLGLFACLNVIPVPTQFASAYRAGIPLFGLAGLVASIITPDQPMRHHMLLFGRRIVMPPIARAVTVGGIAIWCAIVTVEDVPNWHDETRLMRAEVAADPNFVCSRAALGSFEDQHGHFEVALKQFDLCLAELFGEETSPTNYSQLVRSAAMVRKLQSASTLRYYNPVQYIPQIIRERGRTLLWLHRPADALPDLRAALQIAPADTVARNALAAAYHQLHQESQAEAVRRMDDVLLGRSL